MAANVEPFPLKGEASHADVLDQPGDQVAGRVALAAFYEVSIEVSFGACGHKIKRDGREFSLGIHRLFAKANHRVVGPKRHFVIG